MSVFRTFLLHAEIFSFVFLRQILQKAVMYLMFNSIQIITMVKFF